MLAVLHGMFGGKQPVFGHLLKVVADAVHVVGRGERLQGLNMVSCIVPDLSRFADAFVHMLQL